jgi:hypothetical protein
MQAPAQHAEDAESGIEALLLDADFQKLSTPRVFNVFEAMGMARAEIRHSAFLAHLLDPYESHGLGDRFLRGFLIHACARHPSFRTTDVLLADFNDVVVERERFNIDILITSQELSLACLIENKVGSHEHSDQLARYRSHIASELSGLRHHVLVYLTPDGESPSDSAYVPIDYTVVVKLAEAIASESAAGEIQLVLNHYASLLREHVVTDDRIVQLCHQVYRKHRHAIDLILEHGVADQDNALAEIVGDVVDEQIVALGFVKDRSTSRTLRFADPALDKTPGFLDGTFSESKRLLLYEVAIRQDRVTLLVQLGPGNADSRTYIHAALDTKPFNRAELYPAWYRAYATDLVTPDLKARFDVSDAETVGEVRASIANGLRQFAAGVATDVRRLLLPRATQNGPRRAPN